MKSLFYAMALSLLLMPLAACETLVDTPGENWNRWVRAADTNIKQIPDDFQRSIYWDRGSWLSRHPVPND